MKEEIINLIETLMMQIDHEFLAVYEMGTLEYWATGNYDDCFEQGMSIGSDQEALRIVGILKNIVDNSN